MNQRRVINPKTCLRGLSALLFATLASQAALAADTGYPPPPGPYRSDPLTPPELTGPPFPGVPRKDDRQGHADPNHGSRLLPLPTDSYAGKSDSYGAGNLFGSAAPADEQAPTGSGAPGYATETDRVSDDFSADSSRSDRTPRYQAAEGRFDPAYPPYPNTYSGYPQATGRYYPDQGMNYPQPPAGHAYQDYYAAPYAPAYPQAGSDAPPQAYVPADDPAFSGYAPDSYYTPGFPQGYESPDGSLPSAAPVRDTTMDSRTYPADNLQPTTSPDGAIFRPAD